MLPRNSADYRTILWVLIAPALVATQYVRPDLVPILGWFSAYFALASHIEVEEMELFPAAMFGFDDDEWDAMAGAHSVAARA